MGICTRWLGIARYAPLVTRSQVPKPRQQTWINKPKNAANLSAGQFENKNVKGNRDPSQ
ncbi:MAG: hypothetical protein OXU68_14835 [Bacteroidota bacterium]|nr:hypothetical protein [Bacteroidota bacterium]